MELDELVLALHRCSLTGSSSRGLEQNCKTTTDRLACTFIFSAGILSLLYPVCRATMMPCLFGFALESSRPPPTPDGRLQH